MKAVLSRQAGGPESLELAETAAPTAGPGEALVAIRACGVNFPDVLMIEDKYQFKPPRPFAPGGEISGVVQAVGDGVTRLKVGDRVIGKCGTGGMAEQIVMPAELLIPFPQTMPFDEAAAFLLTYGTSYFALKDRARIKAGETLLVLGAAGGVGLAAVELGKALGARVIAACSSAEKVALAKAHGADDGFVYGRGPFDDKAAQKALADGFKAAVGPNGADVIYDAVGGDYAEPALRSIAWDGRYLVVGFAAGPIPRIPLNLPLLKNCEIVGVHYGPWTDRDPAGYAAQVAELVELYLAGKIRPHVSERFPLARAPDAIARLASRQAMGKVVVTVD